MKTNLPDRVPVIVQIRKKKEYSLVKKCLAPEDITIGQFMFELRKYEGLRSYFLPGEAYFLATESNVIPPIAMVMADVYKKWQCEEDGLLYLYLTGQDAFG